MPLRHMAFITPLAYIDIATLFITPLILVSASRFR
jgi:hypothetical protein